MPIPNTLRRRAAQAVLAAAVALVLVIVTGAVPPGERPSQLARRSP